MESIDDLSAHQEAARVAREALNKSEATLYHSRNKLRQKRDELSGIVRLGETGSVAAQSLEREIETLESQIEEEINATNSAKSHLAEILNAFPLFDRPWELVKQLDDHLPFLLFPVRIETRFVTVDNQKYLWVRIFPDDIAVHTHEEELTQDEVNAGITYWKEIWRARQETGETKKTDAEKETWEKGAWRVLAQAFGGNRAAWIRNRTWPKKLEVDNIDDLQFPEFAEESLKPESWSRAPRSKIMPDHFVVMAFPKGRREAVYTELGDLIPDPLILGPNPQQLDTEYQQQDGELLAGEDIDWIYDFKKAVASGMAVSIRLDPPYTTEGFDRVLVLGLRLSSKEDESQALLEELIKNHNYSQGGLSLVPQGTPTNNTSGEGSGFSNEDPGAETSFAVKTGDALFEPTGDAIKKSDGQRLAEALGIDHKVLQQVQHVDRTDIREAMLMNRALWNGTLGYYLEEMLGLNLDTVRRVRAFFTQDVTGRGPLPAIRVGSQPYGVLLTSDFSRWKWWRERDEEQLDFLVHLYEVLQKLEEIWHSLQLNVSHISASTDSFQNLLTALGLHASSVEFHRRHAVGKDYLWNYAAFTHDPSFGQRIAGFIAQRLKSLSVLLRWRIPGLKEVNLWKLISSALGGFSGPRMMRFISEWAKSLLKALGYETDKMPRLFDLSFFTNQDKITDPLVDDIPPEEIEKVSETKPLKSIYRVPDPATPGTYKAGNYISWLINSSFGDIKTQNILLVTEDDASAQPSVPRPLLYRMLRGSLLQATYDATMRLYAANNLVPPEARRELEFYNILTNRTVTRWEFMEADAQRVLPQVDKEISIGQYLQTDEGQALPEAHDLREVRESLTQLHDLSAANTEQQCLSTAKLERIFAEHIDLCSYRLDAWQMGCFYHRLQQQRYLEASHGEFEQRVQGIYLGAFGWLENVHPEPEAAHADLSNIPTSLHDPGKDGPILEQPGNGGFIHGPSLNHAAAAAVLRNTYLSHRDEGQPEKMAVNLTSRRVRTALSFLEGVRNGQELGALLGYQFERGLHERHGDPALNQYIPRFRKRYPLVADKITPTPDGEQIEPMEDRNVLDGYALVEAVFLKDSPLEYPYGVDLTGTPAKDQNSEHGKAIQEEVARLADSLDAIGDLALAEGIFQVTQGNYDRAGAMLKSLTQGGSPPEPEIIQTPRSGSAITQRIALQLEHLEADTYRVWPGQRTERAKVEPGLNQFLVDLLPAPDQIQYHVRFGEEIHSQSLIGTDSEPGLDLQPIDLLYMVGDDLVGEKTELERRIIYRNRRSQQNDALEVNIDFMTSAPDSGAVTLFELLPLLKALRQLITRSRPLSADDYRLSSETSALSKNDSKAQPYDLPELDTRLNEVVLRFSDAVGALGDAIPRSEPNGDPNPALADVNALRSALHLLADFGVSDSLPLSAFGDSEETKLILTNQAIDAYRIASQRLDHATSLVAAGEKTTLDIKDRVESYRSAAQQVFGPMFNLIPHFDLTNQAELKAAAAFRDADPAVGLIRHHQKNPLIVDEWLQGVTRVRPNAAGLETIQILGEAFGSPSLLMKPLQLPFRRTDYWVAVEYPKVKPEDMDKPGVFIPQGEFLSLIQVLPSSGFNPLQKQSGLLIDEWVEVIPSKVETTGIAFHYNQPSTEPPQVMLLAVTPEVTGTWTWDKLVGILNDTLDRAKLRAVEPDLIGQTALGHLLPSILPPVNSYPFATISTDLIHQTAVDSEDTSLDIN